MMDCVVVSKLLTDTLTNVSLAFSGCLYAISGCGGMTSFTKADDNNVLHCLCTMWVMLGLPVPSVVMRGIELASS